LLQHSVHDIVRGWHKHGVWRAVHAEARRAWSVGVETEFTVAEADGDVAERSAFGGERTLTHIVTEESVVIAQPEPAVGHDRLSYADGLVMFGEQESALLDYRFGPCLR